MGEFAECRVAKRSEWRGAWLATPTAPIASFRARHSTRRTAGAATNASGETGFVEVAFR